VIGLDVDRAENTLRNAGFDSVQTEEVDSTAPADQVVDVNPREGQSVDPGTTVTLQVSDGDAAVPDVTGQQQAAATQKLRDAGFTNVTPEQVESPQPKGTVVATDPSHGEQASADDLITLQVSAGEEQITVPEVEGQSEAQARAALQRAGFTNVTVTRTSSDDVRQPQAVSTTPSAGSQAAASDPITLLIADPSPDTGSETTPTTPGAVGNGVGNGVGNAGNSVGASNQP
jgi:serine/threonine-protein kinase